MDTLSKADRSRRMALIKSAGNKSTEIAIIKQFRAMGVNGWRRNYKLSGRPDFVFPRLHLVIFIDGCFWHGCEKHRRIPKDNAIYWTTKILRNKKRDKDITRLFRKRGWRVLRIWEHEIENRRGVRRLVKRFSLLAENRLPSHE